MGYTFGEGAYFSPNPDTANGYATGPFRKLEDYPNNARVFPSYVKLEKPFVTSSDAGVSDIANDLYRKNPSEYKRIAKSIADRYGYSSDDGVGTNQVGNQWLRENGYDGIIKEWNKGEPLEVVAFYPEQIRTAIGSNAEHKSTPFKPEDWRVTVQQDEIDPRTNQKIPTGYVQMDEVVNGKNIQSSNPEKLQALGYDVPGTDQLKKLPTGQYTLQDAMQELVNPKPLARVGIVSGTKLEAWADEVIAKAGKRFNVGINPELALAGVIKGAALLERGIRPVVDWGREMVNSFGDEIIPHLAKLRADSERLLSDPDERKNTENLLKIKQAEKVTGQIPGFQKAAQEIQKQTEVRNNPGNVVLKGADLARQQVFDKVSQHPLIKRFFIEPVSYLKESSRQLGQAATIYRDIKADPTATVEVRSRAMGGAAKQLDNFYSALQKFYNSYDARRDKLVGDLEAFSNRKEEAKGNADLLNVLMNDFRDAAKQVHRQAADSGAVKAYRRMLGSREAIKNVLGFVAANVDLGLVRNKGITDVAGLVKLIQDESRRFITEDKGFEQVVGANSDVIKEVASYLIKSEPLRARMMEGKNILDASAGEAPLSQFKDEFSRKIRAGDFNGAMKSFVNGVGSTAIERHKSRSAASFWKSQEKRTLTELLALDEVNDIVRKQEGSPEFRSLADEVYKDLGEREVIKGIEGNTIVYQPIFKGDKPTVLRFTMDGAIEKSNLEAIKSYFDRAIEYLAHPDDPDYDPRKASALRAFIADKGQLLNPSVNPAAGKLVAGGARTIMEAPGIKQIFSFLGRPDLVPEFVLDRAAGTVANLASRTLNAYSTMQEQKTSILLNHNPRLNSTLIAAIYKHSGVEGGMQKFKAALGWRKTMNIDEYRDKIFAPLAASRQYFENTNPLKAGDAIGNGYTILPEDVDFLNLVKDFEKETIDTVSGVGRRAFESIHQNPGGILFNVEGKKYVRMPYNTGPDTLSRRSQTLMYKWVEDWEAATTQQQKIDVIDSNVGRLLFGYVMAANEPVYNFDFKYRPELKTVIGEIQKENNPITSFEDLLGRVVDHYSEREDAPEETPEQIGGQMLKEIGDTFKRWRKFNPARNESGKTLIDTFGGEDSFNTERGQQIIPSLWYQYGSVDMGERVAYLHNSTVFFAMEHIKAITALDNTIKRMLEDKLAQAKTTGSMKLRMDSLALRKAGKEFYSWGELDHLSRNVTEYLRSIDQVLKFQEQVPTSAASQSSSGEGLMGNPFFSYTVGSVLTGPQANIFNTFGGGFHIVSFDMQMRNQSALSALPKLGVSALKSFYKDIIHLGTHEGNPVTQAVYKALGDASSIPLVGVVAEHILNHATEMRDIYAYSRDKGLSLNVDYWNTINTELSMSHLGGYATRPPVSGFKSAVTNPIGVALRTGAQTLKQATVGFVDSRLNTFAVGMANDMHQDLMNRAIQYGSKRELAGSMPGDIGDLTNLKNRFSADELVGRKMDIPSGREGAAIRLRKFFESKADVNLDSAMWDFYKRFKDLPEAEQARFKENGFKYDGDLRMLNDAQFNQLALATSTFINQADFSNRPLSFKTSKARGVWGLFLGYPMFSVLRAASAFDRVANTSWTKGRLANLPLAASIIVSSAVLGALGMSLSEEVKRKLLNRRAPFPTVFDKNQTAKSYAFTMLNSAAAMWPFYGSAVNYIISRAYKQGFNPQSMIVGVNLFSDMADSVKKMYQSGEVARPLAQFATRWVFPFNYSAPHINILSGLTELSQTQNTIASGLRMMGEEIKIKPPYAGDVVYGPKTGPMNDWKNAVGNHDLNGSIKSFQALVGVELKLGEPDPEAAALKDIEAQNPMRQVVGKMLNDYEWFQLTSNLDKDDADKVRSDLNFYSMAVQAVGGSEPSFTSDDKGGGGSGGSSGSAGVPATASSGGSGGPLQVARTGVGGIGGGALPGARIGRGGGAGLSLRSSIPKIGRMKIGGKLRFKVSSGQSVPHSTTSKPRTKAVMASKIRRIALGK